MTRRRFRFRRPSVRIESMEQRVLFAAGDIDPTFGGHDGVVVQDVVPYVNADFSRNDYKHGEGEESLHDAIELPDGRLLAVGGGDGSCSLPSSGRSRASSRRNYPTRRGRQSRGERAVSSRASGLISQRRPPRRQGRKRRREEAQATDSQRL